MAPPGKLWYDRGMMGTIRSFAPIAGAQPKILILGSMPSVKSLEMGQYYAHQRNAFWRILFDLMGEELSGDYDKKQQLLKDHGIALWDVLKACERRGSLDSAIRNEEPNDFEAFLKEHPSIERIVFNGGKAFSSFRRHVGFAEGGMAYVQAPSTSPAHAIPYGEKLEAWRKAISL